LAPCCGEYFGCRFCHDAAKYDSNPDPKKAHPLDRKAVKTVQCMRCNTVQDASQICSSCGITLGTYWCPTCVLLDDVDKGQFHCDKCGICRVGGQDNHTHCDKCGICVKTAAFAEHTCASNAALTDCSVCLESLHTSREPTQFLPCGHGLHGPCLRSFVESGQSTCPLCKKSMMSKEQHLYYIDAMDEEIAATPMPMEYRNKRVRVRCYECREESDTPFHILKLKCRAPAASCGGSYNTVKIGEAPDATDEEAAAVGSAPPSASVEAEPSDDRSPLQDLVDALMELVQSGPPELFEEDEESD
jgi:RING finger/CHY zinc finger protein 1